jgi:hypothetical protein
MPVNFRPYGFRVLMSMLLGSARVANSARRRAASCRLPLAFCVCNWYLSDKTELIVEIPIKMGKRTTEAERRALMKKALIFLSMLVSGAGLPAGAQTQPEIVVESIRVKVKPGEGPQWEAAYKRFLAWEHQHDYPFGSSTFSIIAGEHTGQYSVGIDGPHWSDFDKMDKLDSSLGVEREFEATLAPYTESIERTFGLVELDLSVTPITEHTPRPLHRVVRYSLKPGSLPAVTDLIRQMNVAIKKTNWTGGRAAWFELAPGEGTQLSRGTGFEDWADFEAPTPSLRAVLAKVYGKARAAALLHEFNEQLESVSSQVLRYRSSLSYTAATP